MGEATQVVKEERKEAGELLIVYMVRYVQYWYQSNKPLLTEPIKLYQHAEKRPQCYHVFIA